MAKSYNQKAKILFLERMLRETGENHVVTMQEILEKLSEQGICAERKSIYDDMEALRAFGMDVRFKRGKTSGYYVYGQEGKAEEPAVKKPEAVPEAAPEKKTVSASAVQKPEAKFERKISADSGKQMKLQCSVAKEREVRAYFGRSAEYKGRGYGSFTVIAPNMSDAQFFGWLTAMGREVHIVKPKKTAAAYRDYLKLLAKEYKGI